MHGGDRYRSPFRHLEGQAFIDAFVEDLRDVLATTTAGDVACMIAEPIQGVGGFTVPPDGLLGALQEVCREHGILWITDEVQTGWGRTGEHFWGYQAHGVEPDMLTFAKGLGNGLSMAGVVASAPTSWTRLQANSISTFGGNPLVLRRRARQPPLPARPRPAGQRAAPGRDDCSPPCAAGRRLGAGRRRARQGPDDRRRAGRPRRAHARPRRRHAVLEACKAEGLLIGKGGLYGNCLRIAPPLTLTDDECAEGPAILVDALRSLAAGRADTEPEMTDTARRDP